MSSIVHPTVHSAAILLSMPCLFLCRNLTRSIGEAGMVEAETDAILLEYEIDQRDFSSAVEDCLPKDLPWTIPKAGHALYYTAVYRFHSEEVGHMSPVTWLGYIPRSSDLGEIIGLARLLGWLENSASGGWLMLHRLMHDSQANSCNRSTSDGPCARADDALWCVSNLLWVPLYLVWLLEITWL